MIDPGVTTTSPLAWHPARRFSTATLLLLCNLLLLLAAPPATGQQPAAAAPQHPWPSQRGTAAGHAVLHWDNKPEADLPEWHFRSKVTRRYQRGTTVWASPAIALVDDRPVAFIGGYDQTLHALDLLNKQRLWFKISNGIIADAPVVGTIAGRQIVFFGSNDRYVYAQDARTGSALWSHELVKSTPTLTQIQVTAPMLLGNRLYIGCFAYDKAIARSDQNGWLYAIDASSGSLLWRQELSQGPVTAPIGASLAGRDLLFIAARRGRLFAFDVTATLPQPLWQFQMPHEIFATPAIDLHSTPARLFLGSKFGDLIAVNLTNGEQIWRRMTGNWVDNSACVADINGERIVLVGSHDYNLYALRAADGSRLWKRPLGGEIYAAPTLFQAGDQLLAAVACLDNQLYVLDAATGAIKTSFFTGQPVWDNIAKGETLWGSPAAISHGQSASLVHGSYNGYVYCLPLDGDNSLRSKAQTPATLWYGLAITALLFLAIILPMVLRPSSPQS